MIPTRSSKACGALAGAHDADGASDGVACGLLLYVGAVGPAVTPGPMGFTDLVT